MPPKPNSRLRLTVEGVDDKHTILNLLKRHGVDWDAPHAQVPYVHDAGSLEQVLDAIGPGVLSYDRFGIVVDADIHPERRWAQIRDRLQRQGINAPEAPEPLGTILISQTHKRFGVWLMPDNRDPGILEDFLAKLVPAEDSSWAFAGEATARARTMGAPLPEKDISKGAIYTWLAWRDPPGMPFGTALTARVLRHDAAEAAAFVAWFHRLFVEG